jgi:hypothetical protein
MVIILFLIILYSTPASAGNLEFGSTVAITGQQNTIENKEGMTENSLNSWYGMQTAQYSYDARLGYLDIHNSDFGFALSINSFGSYIENNSSTVSIGGGFHLFYDSKDVDQEDSVFSISLSTMMLTKPYSMDIDTKKRFIAGNSLLHQKKIMN